MGDLNLNDLHNFTQDLNMFADNFEEQCREDKIRQTLNVAKVNEYYKRILAQNQACWSRKTRNGKNMLLLVRGDAA